MSGPLVALILGILLVFGSYDLALAHASVVRTDPADVCVEGVGAADADCAHGSTLSAPPTAVRVWLNEPVQPFGEGIRVIGPDGRRVDQGPTRAAGPALVVGIDARQEGTYRVSWQVVAEDTHPTVGHFAFSVGRPSSVAGDAADSGVVGPIDLALQVAGRWLHFVGLALGFGVLTVLAVIARASRDDGLARGAGQRLWPLVNAGVLALLLAEPLSLLGQTGSLGAAAMLDPDTVSAALDSSFGRAMGIRLGGALALWVVVGIARDGARRAELAGVTIGVGLAFLDGLAAHAIETQPVWLGLAANGLHLAAMSLWVGALFAVIALGRASSPDVSRNLRRLAGGAIGVALGSGLILAAQHLPGPGDLLAPGYGLALLAKLAVAAVAVGLGVVAARRPGRVRGLVRRVEAGVLLGVLVLAGVLVSLAPPR